MDGMQRVVRCGISDVALDSVQHVGCGISCLCLLASVCVSKLCCFSSEELTVMA